MKPNISTPYAQYLADYMDKLETSVKKPVTSYIEALNNATNSEANAEIPIRVGMVAAVRAFHQSIQTVRPLFHRGRISFFFHSITSPYTCP